EISCRLTKLETLSTNFEIDVDYDATPNEIADKYEKITEEFERIEDYQKTIYDLRAKHKILFEKLEAQCADSNALHNNIPTQNNSRQQISTRAPQTLIPVSQAKTTTHETNHPQPIGNRHISHSLNFNDHIKTIKNDTNGSYTSSHTQMPEIADSDLRENLNTTLDRHAKINKKKISNTINDKNNLSKIIQIMKRKKRSPNSKRSTYYRRQKEIKQKHSGQTKRNASKFLYKFVIQNSQSFRRKKWKYLTLDKTLNLRNFDPQWHQKSLKFPNNFVPFKIPTTSLSQYLPTYTEPTECPNDMIKRGIEEYTNVRGIKENTNVARIEENTNTSEIEENINTSEIEENTNVAGIEENTNVVRIKENTNVAGIEENTNVAEIEENTNVAEIEEKYKYPRDHRKH
ncbi:hypothetical protein PV326_000964, partial [Microctonus aethiopoides]